MKISKQLSKILIFSSLILFVQITQAQEIKEIWTEIEKKKEVSSNETTNNENILGKANQLESIKVKLLDENILVDDNLDNSNILLAGLFDPDDNDLDLDMWSKTDGIKIKKVLQRIQTKKLSKFSERLMDVALLTNSYIPNQNFSLHEFENYTLDHLIKKKDFNLVEEFIQKNSSIKVKFNFFDKILPIDDFPDPIIPINTIFLFDFMSFYIEKTQICLILKLINYMQFTKNTSKDKIFTLKTILKIVIASFIIVFGIIVINQINLPAPDKQIEKILPNENFKTIK